MIKIQNAAYLCVRPQYIRSRLGAGALGSAQAEHHLQPPTPFYSDTYAVHIDSWCEKAQNGFGGGMKLECGRYQEQSRRLRL